MVKKTIKKIKPRVKDTHKGNYGHIFIMAGSVGMTGAAYLTSQSALLSGSGLVTLGIPKSLNQIMEIKLTEVMTLPLEETKGLSPSSACKEDVLDFTEKTDVLAIGPGISRNKDTQKLIRSLLSRCQKPIILDADGINAFIDHTQQLTKRRSPLIITPHPGEMARLMKVSSSEIQNDRVGTAKRFSKKIGAVVVLKGFQTVVAEGDKVYINSSGNPGMATGGTGDVLTGIIASLVGQGLEPFGAAKLASYVHGLAGDIAMREEGEISLVATDLIKYLPKAFKAL